MTPVATIARSFRCGVAARWLPRATAAALLLASMLAAFRFDALRSRVVGLPLQAVFILVGGAVALWILRSGAEVRVRIDLEGDQVVFAYGSHVAALGLEEIERFEFDHPMTASRRILPAAVLIDGKARAWRLPAVLESGADLIEGIVVRSGRDDLAAWADSLSLTRRMNRPGLITAVGYAGALSVVAGALWFYLH